MCGRYTLTTDLKELQRRFDFLAEGLHFSPQHNIAPTESVLTVVEGGKNKTGPRNEVQMARWGLMPFWAKSPSAGSAMINARAETLLVKPAYKESLLHRRCLILADSFYDWRREGKQRIPFRFTLKDGGPFALAGLWAISHRANRDPVVSCSIITTEPNELVSPVHNRMAAILASEAEDMWLDQSIKTPEVLLSMLRPFPAHSMKAYEVSQMVNSALNKDPACITPASNPRQQWLMS